MTSKLSDKIIFRGVIIYLPFSIFLMFWLYLVSLVYTADVWQYQLFYGKDGNIALLWLFVSLIPALLFLVLKARGKVFLTRFFGAAGFYCLLGSLISSHAALALPGFVLLVISVVINRRLRKHKASEE